MDLLCYVNMRTDGTRKKLFMVLFKVLSTHFPELTYVNILNRKIDSSKARDKVRVLQELSCLSSVNCDSQTSDSTDVRTVHFVEFHYICPINSQYIRHC